MPVHKAINFPPGMYVEDAVNCEWIGTVKGITINTAGEPVLVVDMVFANGYDVDRVIYHETRPVHPSKVKRLDESTVLSWTPWEQSDEYGDDD